MAQHNDFDRLNLLKEARIPAVYFARFAGIHRVTISQWVNKHPAAPRPVYWARASQVLDMIARGIERGVFPLKHPKKQGYESFAALMASLTA